MLENFLVWILSSNDGFHWPVRQNAIQLEEKEKREKEILSQIIEEATEYKVAFHEKRKVTCENNTKNNREKEKVRVCFLDLIDLMFSLFS